MKMNYQKRSRRTFVGLLAAWAFALLLFNSASAQVSLYGLTQLTGQTYQSLSGGTVINSAAQLANAGTTDDGYAYVVMPFAFPYGGSTFDSVTFSTNYWIAFGHQAPDAIQGRTPGNLFTSTLPNNTLAPFFRDGNANFGATGQGEMRHGLDGSTGIYVFEWFQASGNSFNISATVRITFQIRLHGPASANPGRIEFAYGPSTGTITTGTTSIGIENATSGTGNYLNALNGTSNSTATTTTYPGNGFVYRFNPPSPMVFNGATVLGVNNNPAARGAVNVPMYVLNVTTSNALNPLSVSSLTVNPITQNISNIDSIKIFYTGSSATFSTATQFGSAIGSVTTGANAIAGTQTLGVGNNYFWVTYNVSNTAVLNDSLSGQATSVTVNGTPQTPTVTQSSTSRIIRNPLAGTYTVGTGGQYANLGAAFADINALGLSANVNLNITSNIVEPASAGLSQWTEYGAGGYNLTIRPTGPNRIISGAFPSAGVIALIGADRVTIDGRIGGTGTGRDLTIRNDDNTTINVAILIAGQTTAAGGCNDITIRNTILMGGPTVGTTAATAGIQAQGTGAPNNNLVITNNEFKRAYRGIFIGTNAPTSPYLGLQITENIIGSEIPGEYVNHRGIQVNQSRGAIISNNHIFNVRNSLSVNNAGIEILTGSDSATVRANKVIGVSNPTASGYGAWGINLGVGNGHLVVNNDISDVTTTNYSATSTTFNAFGIRIAAGTGHRIYHNTVNMSGAYTGTNTTAAAAAVCITAAAVTAEVRNNNFSNTITSNATGNKNMFALWLPDAYVFANLAGTNNNNYFLGSEPYHIFAQRGTTFNTNRIVDFAAWQTASSVDANSVAVNPRFFAANSGVPNAPAMNNLGAPIAGITTDVTGATRSATTPDLGAYEYTPITKDMAAVSLARAGAGCFGSAESIRAIVRNTGLDTLFFGTDTLRVTVSVAGAATANLNATRSSGFLAPNDTLHVLLGPVNMLAFGTYNVNGSINQQNDGIATNNSFGTLSLQSTAPIAIPFAANFDGPTNNTLSALQTAGWSVVGTWTVGASGHGNPGNGLYSNIWSSNPTPSFTLPFAGQVLANSSFAFNYRLVNFTNYGTATQTAYPPGAGDSIWFDISTDCGVTFQRLYTINATTHVVDTNWASINIPLAAYAGQNVIIRLRSQWATGDYFLDLDNVGITAPLSAFNLLAPANNTRLVAGGQSSATVNISWSRAIQGPATYTWLVDAPGGNFSTPLVALPANNNGLDSNLTLTIGQIHNLLGTLGVAIGDSTNIIWTVRAQLGTQTQQATQTWSARLVRGTLAPLRLAVAPVGTTTTQVRAPNGLNTHTFLRAATFVPASELAAAGIDSGESIANVSFRLTAGANVPNKGRFVLYLGNGQNTTYTRGTAWTSAINGLVVRYDDSLSLRTTAGLMTLQLSQPFVYTGGSIEIAYDWAAVEPFATSPGIATYAANSAITASLVSAASQTTVPVNMAATAFRPEFVWGVDDRKANDMEVITMFAKGQNPRQWGSPEVVQAIVRNNSFQPLSNINVTLNVAGANTFTNSQTVASLGIDSQAVVNFAGFSGTNLGFNNMTVSVPNDDVNSNNSKVWRQQQTDSIFSYNDTVTTGLGSVGYNTGSGLLLARFSVTGHRSVRAARLRIGSGAEIVGNALSAVVVNDSGVIVAQSAPVTIAAGQLNTWVVFTFANPVNVNNGNFYIGMAQPANATTGYFPMGFQTENPTRANAYFTAPLAGGAVPAPVAGFRLMIEAHMGAPVVPVDSLSFFVLRAPANNTVVNLEGDPTQTINVRWNRSVRSVGTTPVTYRWLLDVPGTNFANPVVTVNAGTDTSLTFTYGQIVDTLASRGIQVGQGFVGRWTVRAVSDTLNRLAVLPFNLTLNRGVMSSIEETEFSKSIVLYPNPAAYTAKLQVRGADKDLQITVVNAVGQEMKKLTVNSGVRSEIEIDLANLNEGMYFVRISDGSNLAIKRLMIQR